MLTSRPIHLSISLLKSNKSKTNHHLSSKTLIIPYLCITTTVYPVAQIRNVIAQDSSFASSHSTQFDIVLYVPALNISHNYPVVYWQMFIYQLLQGMGD